MTQVIVKYRSIMVFKNIRIFIQTFHTKGLCRREIATYKIYFHIPGLSELKVCKKNMVDIFINIERDTALNIRGHRMYTPCLLHGRNESMANIINCHTTWIHDAVIKWKHSPRYWPFLLGIHRSQVNTLTKVSNVELCCFLWFAPE